MSLNTDETDFDADNMKLSDSVSQVSSKRDLSVVSSNTAMVRRIKIERKEAKLEHIEELTRACKARMHAEDEARVKAEEALRSHKINSEVPSFHSQQLNDEIKRHEPPRQLAPSLSSGNNESILRTYLDKQGGNECINLTLQIAYDESNIAFVFYENEIRRLMEVVV